MKNKKEIETEQILLNNASLDELIKLKMEEEINEEFNKLKTPQTKKVLSLISDVPPELIFSKLAIYKVFNRKTKVETYINGIQAESMLGLQTSVRNKIQKGEMDAFSTISCYVKFEKIEI